MSDIEKLYFQYNSCFSPDDFDRINIKYFSKLRDNGDMSTDPSGWLNTTPIAANIINDNNYIPYYSDYNYQLKKSKNQILELISAWEHYRYDYDEITLCHSVTVGLVIALSFFKKLGIKNIIFETPAYFSTISQAEHFGFKTLLFPTYLDTNFFFDISADLIKQLSPCAIVLTQPRSSLGLNQDSNHIQDIYSRLSPKDYLLIDEASEQYFPSVLNSINIHEFENVIRIRSFIKGMGLNGIRLSFMMHSKNIRPEIQNHMEVFQGAIDYYSLNTIFNLSSDIDKFKSMLAIANQQVIELRQKVERALLGSQIIASKLVNGYMGSLSLNFNDFTGPILRKRENLLKFCYANKMPIIIGSTMRFSKHEKTEFIKINYFKSTYEILKGINILLGFFNWIQ